MPKTRAELLAEAWNSTNPPVTQWVVEARADEVVVVDDANPEQRVWLRVPAVVTGDRVTFGQPRPYNPADDATVVYASAADSRALVAASVTTISPTGPDPGNPPADTDPDPEDDPSTAEPPAAEPDAPPTTEPEGDDPVSTLNADLRERLGLADDADDTAILAAVADLKDKADNPPTPEPDPATVAASAAHTERVANLEAKVELLTEQLTAASQELAATREQKAADTKQQVLAAARRDGKFPPADEAKWADRYDKNPEVVTEVLASIPAGTAVPVNPAGYTSSPDDPTDEGDEFDALFSAPAPKGR